MSKITPTAYGAANRTIVECCNKDNGIYLLHNIKGIVVDWSSAVVEVVVSVIENATFTIVGVILWVHIHYVHRAVARRFHFSLWVIGTLLGLFRCCKCAVNHAALQHILTRCITYPNFLLLSSNINFTNRL